MCITDMSGGATPEDRLLALIKRVQYGVIEVLVKDGTPVEFRATVRGHLTKGLLPSQIELIDTDGKPKDQNGFGVN